MRKSLWIILAVMIVAVGAPNAQADTTFDLNLPANTLVGGGPIPAALIPVESFMIFPTPTTCGGGGVIGGDSCLELTRKVDSFSPLLFNITVTGTTYPTGSVDTFDSSFSTTIPITSFVMTDIFFASIQHSGSQENPIENVFLEFATGTLVSNVPEPSSIVLLGSGLLGLAGIKRRRSGC